MSSAVNSEIVSNQTDRLEFQLARLSKILDVPISRFHSPLLKNLYPQEKTTEAENLLALIEAYLNINDASARMLTINMVRSLGRIPRQEKKMVNECDHIDELNSQSIDHIA
ncbi:MULTISPECIES: hypothetical protein [unclassified Methylobacterium]|uniref:hypothetical protein n=1 Tax=unclassified Methylobacterium TaxID=2615210 RepID=UPI0011C1F19D|nr:MULTISPECIES: hypothetical protein [unclassified Methylobacterium]QEE37959.1 hypothetical protein FVA80_02240 [Methylobacterium sp. WL1]TXN59799.1 hypothetical protein FV241_00070 [Methylobacterium sp. WL2]